MALLRHYNWRRFSVLSYLSESYELMSQAILSYTEVSCDRTYLVYKVLRYISSTLKGQCVRIPIAINVLSHVDNIMHSKKIENRSLIPYTAQFRMFLCYPIFECTPLENIPCLYLSLYVWRVDQIVHFTRI